VQNFKQIEAFLIVAELKSFKHAAAKLKLSTMAISKQIKNLEDQIKEQLFIRTTRRVSLTEFGERFYQQAKKLEQHWQELDEFIDSHKEEPQGTLNICITLVYDKKAFLKPLAEFKRNYPKIQLNLLYIEEPDQVLTSAKKIDIFFGMPMLPGITDNFKYRKIYEIKNILCASKTFIEKYGKPKSAEDLVNFKYITHSLRDPLNVIKLADETEILTSEPDVIMNSFEALNIACIEGMGILLAADALVEDAIQSGKLVSLLPHLDYRKFDLHLFYRPMTYELPSVKVFVDFFSSQKI
jgi:DNA-binding transcriptional LysR family regulator